VPSRLLTESLTKRELAAQSLLSWLDFRPCLLDFAGQNDDAPRAEIMECILETKAVTILEFIHGLHGSLSVTFEEGTSAACLHDLLKPHVTHLVVCDARKNALLKDGSKSDRIDARKLGGLVTWQPAPSGVPRRARGAHLKGAGAQLSDPHPGCAASHESDQSAGFQSQFDRGKLRKGSKL